MTSAIKKQHHYLNSQQMTGQDYPNTCYQLNGTNNNNQNPLGYPPPPSYGAPMHGNTGGINSAYQTTPGLFGYSRPPSPMYPHSNVKIELN